MKSLRIFVFLILLGLAAPVAVHYRAWSLGIPQAASSARARVQAPYKPSAAAEPQNQAAHPDLRTASPSAVNSQPPNPSFNLPAASSSLPLLSVIGFGVFLGGLVSALKTRPAHK